MKLFTSKFVFLSINLCSILLQAPTIFAAKADNGPDFMPLGVYLSWELTEFWAQEAKIDRWQDVQKRLDVCAKRNVNTLWVTNMIEQDIPRLLIECEKRNIRLIPSVTGVDAKLEWRFADPNYYPTVIPRLAAIDDPSHTLAGWILSDEPLEKDMLNVEKLRQIFAKYDPNRFTLAVTMWPQTPLVPQLTNLSTVCIDVYPFYGPNDLNGPHTDDSSKSFYRACLSKMVNDIGSKNIKPWVMPQCFVEIMGPFTCDANDNVIALPGSYYHWRMPTCAEMRWQVWEAIRGQIKGIVFFQAAPVISCSEEIAKKPPLDCSWKEILLKEPINTGPGALLTRDGEATIQMDELGELYGKLAPLTELIYRWIPAKGLIAEAQCPAQIQNFYDPEKNYFYSVVVNDDLQSTQNIVVRFETQTKQIIDMTSKKLLPMVEEFAGGGKTTSLLLRPGDGTIIQIQR